MKLQHGLCLQLYQTCVITYAHCLIPTGQRNMAYSSKWEMTVFEIQTRDIHILFPHPYLSNTPTNLCMALFNFSLYFLFFYSYTFVQNFHNNTMPCINLSEYWTTLPPSKSRPLKSQGFEDNLMVSRGGTKISR